MTSKELMYKTFAFEETPHPPVSPHWWGLYKFEYAGIIKDYTEEDKAWAMNGQALADVDDKFYNAFKPDMFHLTTGCSKTPFDQKWLDYLYELCNAIRKFDSYAVLDELCTHVSLSKEEVINSGCFDHVVIHAKNHPDVFKAMNEGNPICNFGYFGFEEGLIAFLEHPKYMEYLIYRLYESILPRMEALKQSGCDGYIGSETLCSADILSPKLYRAIVFPAQQMFYKSIAKIGLSPICYFTGEIMPLLDDIANLGINALMVEENKKDYKLDIAEISKKLYGKVAVFGNIDGIYTILNGTPQDVFNEVNAQLDATGKSGFIVSCGSPVPFGTPPKNLIALRDAVFRCAIR
jgi:hypothetical protein